MKIKLIAYSAFALLICLSLCGCSVLSNSAKSPSSISVSSQISDANTPSSNIYNSSSSSHFNLEDEESDEWPQTYSLKELDIPQELKDNSFLTFFLYLTASTNKPASSPSEIKSTEFLRAMVEYFYITNPNSCTEDIQIFPKENGWDYKKIPLNEFLLFTQVHLGIDNLEDLLADHTVEAEFPVLIVDTVNNETRILLHPTLNFAPNIISSEDVNIVTTDHTIEISIVQIDTQARLKYIFDISEGYESYKLISIT